MSVRDQVLQDMSLAGHVYHPSQPRLQPAEACIGRGLCNFEIFRGCRLIPSMSNQRGSREASKPQRRCTVGRPEEPVGSPVIKQ